MDPKPSPTDPGREAYWRSKLRRFRFGAEPLRVQLDRVRRVTTVLSAVSGGIGLIFVMIFGAFRRPDIGAILVLGLLAPIVGLAWLDYLALAARLTAYEAERATPAPPEGPPDGPPG